MLSSITIMFHKFRKSFQMVLKTSSYSKKRLSHQIKLTNGNFRLSLMKTTESINLKLIQKNFFCLGMIGQSGKRSI